MILENQSETQPRKITLIAIGLKCEGLVMAGLIEGIGYKFKYILDEAIVDIRSDIEEVGSMGWKFFYSIDKLEPDDSVALRHFLKGKDLVYVVTDISRAENTPIVTQICEWVAKSGTSVVFAVGNKDNFRKLRVSENASLNLFKADVLVEVKSEVPLSLITLKAITNPNQRRQVFKIASALYFFELLARMNGSVDINDFTIGVQKSKTVLFTTILTKGADRALIAGKKICSLIKSKKPYLKSIMVFIEACPTMPFGGKPIMQEIRKNPKVNDDSTIIIQLVNFDNSLGLSETRVTVLAAE
jgi:hypothetical protein